MRPRLSVTVRIAAALPALVNTPPSAAAPVKTPASASVIAVHSMVRTAPPSLSSAATRAMDAPCAAVMSTVGAYSAWLLPVSPYFPCRPSSTRTASAQDGFTSSGTRTVW